MDDGADACCKCLWYERCLADGATSLRILDAHVCVFGSGVGRNDLLAQEKLVEILKNKHARFCLSGAFF